MTRQVRVREVLASVEGLALLRRLYEGSDDEAAARIAELRSIVRHDGDQALVSAVPMREVSARQGYDEWAPASDAPGNAIVGMEAPLVGAGAAGAPGGGGRRVAGDAGPGDRRRPGSHFRPR